MPKRPGRFWRRLAPALALAGICAFWCAASQVAVVPRFQPFSDSPVFLGPDGLLSLIERPTIDARFAFRGEIPPPPSLKLVYVNVDSASVEQLGNFPWNREIFARVADALFRHGGIRAMGFDFVFSEAGIPNLGRDEAAEGTLALGRAIREHQNVVVAASYTTGLGLLENKRKDFPFVFDWRSNVYDTNLPELPAYPVVGPGWGRIGLIDVANDDVRSVPMFARTEHQTYFTMSLQLAMLHLGLSKADIERDAIVLRGGTGGTARVPLWLGQFVEPNWFSAWNSGQNSHWPVSAVLELARAMAEGSDRDRSEARALFEEFRDAVVLVGPTDPLFKDTTPAPLSKGLVPRVSLHGNMLKTIVSGRYITRLPAWSNCAIIVFVGLATAGLAAALQRTRGAGWLAFLFAAAYVAAAFVLFSAREILIPVVAPLGCAISCTVLAIAGRLTAEEERRRRIKSLFGSYVSSAVVEEIVERDILPQTGGAEVEVTAFFSDIASFTALSEKLPPALLVDVMCEYFAEGTKAVTDAGGTLDKYVGDAIIAMFGAPLRREDHAAAACRAALGLQGAQKALRSRWAADQRSLPAEVLGMRTRVGLNTGPAVVGNIGSELRFNYTMMGAAVNLAQRIEAAGSHYGAEILASSSTVQAALAQDDQLVFRELDVVKVPGLAASVAIFELLGRGERAREENRRRLSEYAAALALYRGGRWHEAAEAFVSAASHEPPGRPKNPCRVMAGRCETFAAGGNEPAAAPHILVKT